MATISEKIDFRTKFESMLQTLHVLNIVGTNLTEKGKRERAKLESLLAKNSDKYFEYCN